MGGCRCSFRTCERRSNDDPDTHFFHYPFRQRDRCTQWARNAGRSFYMQLPDNQLRNKVVCQEHFRDHCFMNYLHKSLTKTAVPTFIRLPGHQAGVLDFESSLTGEVVLDEDAGAESLEASKHDEKNVKESAPIHMEIVLPVAGNDGEDEAQLHEVIEYDVSTAESAVSNDVTYVDIDVADGSIGDGVDEAPAAVGLNSRDGDGSRLCIVAVQPTTEPTVQQPCTPPPKILNGLNSLSKLKKVVFKRPARAAIQTDAPKAKTLKSSEPDDDALTGDRHTDCVTSTAVTDLQPISADEGNVEQLSELSTVTDEFSNVQSMLADYKAVIAELRADLETHRSAAADQLKRQTNLQQTVQAQAKRLAVQQQHRRDVETLRNTNAEQADQIDQLEAHIELLRQEHGTEVQQQRDQIEHLNGTNRELRTRIDRQSQQIQLHQKQQQQQQASTAAAMATLRVEHSEEVRQQLEQIDQLKGSNLELQTRLDRQVLLQQQEAAATADRSATAAAVATAAAASELPATASSPAPTSSTARAKPEKLPLLSKPQLYNSIRKYLNPSMNTLVRMEMFADVGREYKPDERQIVMELWELPVAAAAAAGSGDGAQCSSAGSVYEYMRSEWRFRLPPKGEVLQWIRERDENAAEANDDWDDC